MIPSGFFLVIIARISIGNWLYFGVKNSKARLSLPISWSDTPCYIFGSCFYSRYHLIWYDQVINGCALEVATIIPPLFIVCECSQAREMAMQILSSFPVIRFLLSMWLLDDYDPFQFFSIIAYMPIWNWLYSDAKNTKACLSIPIWSSTPGYILGLVFAIEIF